MIDVTLHQKTSKELIIKREISIGISLWKVVNHHIVCHSMCFMIHATHQCKGGKPILNAKIHNNHLSCPREFNHRKIRITEDIENMMYILKIMSYVKLSGSERIIINQELSSKVTHIESQLFMEVASKIVLL